MKNDPFDHAKYDPNPYECDFCFEIHPHSEGDYKYCEIDGCVCPKCKIQKSPTNLEYLIHISKTFRTQFSVRKEYTEKIDIIPTIKNILSEVLPFVKADGSTQINRKQLFKDIQLRAKLNGIDIPSSFKSIFNTPKEFRDLNN